MVHGQDPRREAHLEWSPPRLNPTAAAFFSLCLTACQPAIPAGKEGAWASFNGFYPGMSVAEAKSVGAQNCREIEPIAKDVLCDIPADKLQLGPLAAKSGQLRFDAMHQHRLSQIWVSFRGPHFNVLCQETAKAHGQPYQGASGYVWYRSRTPARIISSSAALSGDATRSVLEYRFDPRFSDPKNDPSSDVERGCFPV